MTALKKYRQSLRVRADICDDRLVGADLADAAIAELEAELAETREDARLYNVARKEALAERDAAREIAAALNG